MENPYQSQAMESLYFYNSDLKTDNSHGCFTSQSGNQAQMYQQEIEQQQSMSSFSLSHSSSPPLPLTPQTYHSGYHSLVHHMDSSVPLFAKSYLNQEQAPRMIIDSRLTETDFYGYPTTPPLSATTSMSNSPYIYTGLPTSLSASLIGMDTVKDDCGAENLTHAEWIGCGSPPITPVFIQPHSLIADPNEIIPTHCPFLSPSSPTPYSQSTPPNQQEFDFCDPRNITVLPGSSITHPVLKSAPPTVYAPLANLFVASDEDINKDPPRQGEDLVGSSIQKDSCDQLLLHSSRSPFELYSDLEVEGVLAHGIPKFGTPDNSHIISKRRRSACSTEKTDACNESFATVEGLDHYEGLNYSEDLATSCSPCPSTSGTESKVKREKRGSKPKKMRHDEDGAEFNFPLRSQTFTTFMSSNEGETISVSNDQGSGSSLQAGSSESNTSNSASVQENSALAPVTRRGRKQSLTEDLTKTFVCELCNRRFRRQEHLKRHYRSLHTSDKPYECSHCAKKFSRSDNLTQHLRTHGNAIQVGCIDDGITTSQVIDVGVQHVHELGTALFVAAADAPGSDSEGTSRASSEYDSSSRKKRKRSE